MVFPRKKLEKGKELIEQGCYSVACQPEVAAGWQLPRQLRIRCQRGAGRKMRTWSPTPVRIEHFRQDKIKQLYQMQKRNQKTETEKHPWDLALKGSSVISTRAFLMISGRSQTTEGKMRMKDQ